MIQSRCTIVKVPNHLSPQQIERNKDIQQEEMGKPHQKKKKKRIRTKLRRKPHDHNERTETAAAQQKSTRRRLQKDIVSLEKYEEKPTSA